MITDLLYELAFSEEHAVVPSNNLFFDVRIGIFYEVEKELFFQLQIQLLNEIESST